MIKRKTYRVFENDPRELVYEDTLNFDGKILSFNDYQSPHEAAGFKEYNADGLLLCEREVTDGVESARTENTYNAKGDIIDLKQFIAGELFEQVSYEYTSEGLVRRTFQHGEETSRLVETRNGEKWVKEFIEEGVLFEKQIGRYDPVTNTERVEIFDTDNNLLAVRIEEFDQLENPVRFEERNANGDLLERSEYRYQGNYLFFEKQENFTKDIYYSVKYEYDDLGNLTSREMYSPEGKLLEYFKHIYDDRNRLIRELGYSVGNFNAIYGTYVDHDKYEFVHEFDEGQLTADELFYQADELYKSGELNSAITVLQSIIDATNEKLLKAEAFNNVGYFYLRKGDYTSSINNFLSALEHDPNFGYANDNLGYALIRCGKLEEGWEYLERALATKNNDPAYTYRNMALFFFEKQDINNAEMYFHCAFDSGSPVDLLELHYAEFLFSQGKVEEGKKYLQMAVEKGEPEAIIKERELI